MLKTRGNEIYESYQDGLQLDHKSWLFSVEVLWEPRLGEFHTLDRKVDEGRS